MKKTILATAALLGFAGFSSATVTLQFGDIGFLGEAGQTSAIAWGIVVDTGGDGFDNALWTGIELTDGAIFGGSDDDTFYLADANTIAAGPGGLITNVSAISGAAAALSFGVIWFDSSVAPLGTAGSGNTFGFTTTITPNNTTPNDGATLAYNASNGGQNAGSNAFVPEPSVALLGALGLVGLLRRRR